MRQALHLVCHNLQEHSCEEQTQSLPGKIYLFTCFSNLDSRRNLRIYNKTPPEAECGVGEVGRAVKVPEGEAAPHVIHGGQTHFVPLHHTSPDEALAGPVTQSHQLVVFVKTRGRSSYFYNLVVSPLRCYVTKVIKIKLDEIIGNY